MTNLSPKPDFKAIESKWQDWWEKNKIYAFNPKSNKPVYSVDTPPPYASADHLHVGHACNYTQFEIFARIKRMQGFNVYFPLCFDNNGLPTEKYVENKYNLKKGDMNRTEFIKLCRKASNDAEENYTKRFFKALGHSHDHSLKYTTINPESQKVSQMSFLDLYNKKYAYRAEEPVLWCPHCQTALAQAEVEDKERKTKLNFISFTLEDG
jgi:valyl-tRNA synthetase